MSLITVENLSIKFRIYNDRSPTLKEYFSSIFKQKEKKAYSDFWALKNITFQANAGDRIGLIGHNGAGKSTFLKALCKVYPPQTGNVEVIGKIAPLLEIGAGFHPEFTGLENIYLNGAILGYDKKTLREIAPDIVAFAELDKFINTAVKYYSTGMYMRLAFSLATAVQPDILILDEVFAGGDNAFIKKAQKRMEQRIDQANIMLMVSHNPKLIQSSCNRVVWLDKGEIIADGEPKAIIKSYLNNTNKQKKRNPK